MKPRRIMCVNVDACVYIYDLCVDLRAVKRVCYGLIKPMKLVIEIGSNKG